MTPKHLAGEALRMKAQQRSILCQIAQDDRECGFDLLTAVRDTSLKANGLKHSPPGGHSGGDNASNCPDLRDLCHLILVTFQGPLRTLDAAIPVCLGALDALNVERAKCVRLAESAYLNRHSSA